MKQLITDLKAKLTSINVVTADGITTPLFTILWNNQIEYLKQGQTLALPNLCAFIEIIVDSSNAVGGRSYNVESDLSINIHLLHTHYSTESMHDENLLVYDFRKLVMDKLYDFKANNMVATFDKVGETMDFEHDNLYHYVLNYKTRIREQINTSGIFTLSVPPVSLQINLNNKQILPHT
jgi:hypothetical protein